MVTRLVAAANKLFEWGCVVAPSHDAKVMPLRPVLSQFPPEAREEQISDGNHGLGEPRNHVSIARSKCFLTSIRRGPL